MKKKVRKLRRVSKKKVATKKKYKSYYIPVSQRKGHKASKKTPKKKVAKKKYKSYYKPKKKKVQNEPSVAQLITERESKKHWNSDGTFSLPHVEEKAVEVPRTSKRPVKYLNNRDLLAEVIKSKKNIDPKTGLPKMTSELAKMLQLLTLRYGKKGNFANYTYNDDMQGYAMLMIVKTWQGFDPAKSSNPFAWFTQCIKNSFIQYLNYEKRQRDIKDEAYVDKGYLPSYSYQYEYAEANKGGSEPPAEPENENVELPTKPSDSEVTFEVPEEDDTPVDVLQY